MKKYLKIRPLMLLSLIGLIVLGLMLSGCTKKSDGTYFLRKIKNEYNIVYAEGDTKDFVTKDIKIDNEYEGLKVVWESSHPDLIDSFGKVTLPKEDTKVTLKASFETPEGKKAKKEFVINLVSEETIKNSIYSEAYTAVLVFETKNNLTNYQTAKAKIELVSTDHEKYKNLKERFDLQVLIFETGNLVENYKLFPTTINFETAKRKLDLIPTSNERYSLYLNELESLNDFQLVADKVLKAINEKTKANHDAALVDVEAITNVQVKNNLAQKLEKVLDYINHQEALSSHTVSTSEALETIILKDLNNTLITTEELNSLKQGYLDEQKRLFELNSDKGKAYILEKLAHFEANRTLENAIILDVLTKAYDVSAPLFNEFKANFLILNLALDFSDEAKDKARDAVNNITDINNQKDFEKMYLEQVAIGNSYIHKNDLDLMLDREVVIADYLLKLEDATNNLNFITDETLKAKLIEDLSIHYKAKTLNETILKLQTTPLETKSEKGYLVVELASQAKLICGSFINTKPIFYKQMQQLLEASILARADEVKKLLEHEITEKHQTLLGQLLSQSNSGSYEAFKLRSFKDETDRRSRVAMSRKTRLKILVIFLSLVAFLILHGTTYEYGMKKGYEGFKWMMFSFIPVASLIYFIKAPPKRNVSKSGLRHVYRPTEFGAKFLIYGQLIIITVIVIIPIIYIFGMAFSNLKTDIPNRIWPKEPNWEAFKYLFHETKFPKWWLNTFLIAMVNMLVGTVLITGAAYVFARFSFKGKKAGLLTILVLQSFPSFMGLVAMYVLFWKFGLLGRPMALTILYIGGGIPGSIWLIKGFLDQIPKDLDESAMIDGANKLQIFVRIIMPLAIPILTFVAVSMFMAPWMDYMLPGYLLNVPKTGVGGDYDITQQWTLAVGLFELIKNPSHLNYSAFAAGALLVGLPITILYMFFQKYLIEGIMAGATKG